MQAKTIRKVRNRINDWGLKKLRVIFDRTNVIKSTQKPGTFKKFHIKFYLHG